MHRGYLFNGIELAGDPQRRISVEELLESFQNLETKPKHLLSEPHLALQELLSEDRSVKVWKGTYKGEPVKAVLYAERSDAIDLADWTRKASLIVNLDITRIVPPTATGYCGQQQFAIVSPWHEPQSSLASLIEAKSFALEPLDCSGKRFKYMVQLATALRELHARQVVHGSLATSNVMVSWTDAKLAGISRCDSSDGNWGVLSRLLVQNQAG
jgi:hypothetical protein